LSFDSSLSLSSVGQDSSVCIATRYGLKDPESNPGKGDIFRPWVPTSLLQNEYRVIPGSKLAGGVALTTYTI
jgi:hypothetical protein